jgi:hypothetical protein
MYARDLLENYELSRKSGTLRRTMNDKKRARGADALDEPCETMCRVPKQF